MNFTSLLIQVLPNLGNLLAKVRAGFEYVDHASVDEVEELQLGKRARSKISLPIHEYERHLVRRDRGGKLCHGA